MGVVHARAPQGGQTFLGIFFYFLDNKLRDTEGILISNCKRKIYL